MRGFNQQKDSNNCNPQDSFLKKEIEDYTVNDCEDFLAKYPKDIDADKVRRRLEQLRPKVDNRAGESKPSKSIEQFTLQECEMFLRNKPNSPDTYKVMARMAKLQAERPAPATRQEWHETTFGKLCLTALLLFAWFVLAFILTKFGMSAVKGIGHFILLGVAYSGWKAIWNRD